MPVVKAQRQSEPKSKPCSKSGSVAGPKATATTIATARSMIGTPAAMPAVLQAPSTVWLAKPLAALMAPIKKVGTVKAEGGTVPIKDVLGNNELNQNVLGKSALTKKILSKKTSIKIVPIKSARGKSRSAWRLQLHSMNSENAVRREWSRLRKVQRDLFGDLRLTVTRPAKGPFYRLQVGPLADRRAERRFCAKLKRRDMDLSLSGPDPRIPGRHGRT